MVLARCFAALVSANFFFFFYLLLFSACIIRGRQFYRRTVIFSFFFVSAANARCRLLAMIWCEAPTSLRVANQNTHNIVKYGRLSAVAYEYNENIYEMWYIVDFALIWCLNLNECVRWMDGGAVDLAFGLNVMEKMKARMRERWEPGGGASRMLARWLTFCGAEQDIGWQAVDQWIDAI